MDQKGLNIKLSIMQLFILILNLFIFSSTMRFLPWFVEDAFGWFGILITAPLLLGIGFIMIYLQKSKGYAITATRKLIPFLSSIFSICISLSYITDFSVIMALAVNFGMVIITMAFLLQDVSKLSRN
ncbi:hypothetical protein [Bacillus cereus group sp. BfR-BA-01380]|uniref:hypothetical protein n=1 Tax=Bacillus cereus group sp. BfR-BA-01380 TaxID=2920324 RepID=UPI001F5893DC|nr:hypothetical protein [Bacillus cereus group sp. BfR-BA-01380]